MLNKKIGITFIGVSIMSFKKNSPTTSWLNLVSKKMKTKLMSNEGTIDYMTKDTKKFEKDNIDIIFFKYNNIEYKQLTKKFIQQLSIIDLLFNEGPNSVKIIRNGLEKINI